MSQITNSELILPYGMKQKIRDHLFSDTSRENLCYLLCGHTQIGTTLRLLGCYLSIPEPEDIDGQSYASIRIKREFLIEILQACESLHLSLIDIHSHPFADGNVSFSGIDDKDENEKSQWFATNLPGCYFGSIVMGKNSHASRIYVGKNILRQNLQIKSIEIPLGTQEVIASFDESMYDRQLRAFGKEGQMKLANTSIGIVGLGGLGAGIAIQLARLGVNQFKLFDPDRIDVSNLNRLAGATRIDAELRNYKVDLIARKLMEINPSIKCERVRSNILSRRAWRKLRDVDLIIVATDNHRSRMLLNIVSQMYLIPQISIGTLISTNAGKLEGGHGHIYTILPGQQQPCTLCADIINPVEAYYELATRESRERALNDGYIENFREPAPAVAHLNGVLINLACVEIHNLFCGFKEFDRHLVYSMLDQELYKISESPRNCVTCSEGGGFFGRGDLVKNPLSDAFADIQ